MKTPALHPIPKIVATAILAVALLGLAVPRTAHAFIDQDKNRLDDRIEAVHANGWNAAFVDNDPTKRMKIGVENPANVVYAIYVGYDHYPNAADKALLAGTGVAMVWPFLHINFIESRATWVQIQAILALPGVKMVEAIAVEYPLNHYGARVVRSRDSRGLGAGENYQLFPSVRGNLGFDGTGVVIAILDTGVNDEVDQLNPSYPGHESLKGKFLGGGEFWCGQAACVTAVDASTNPQDHGGDASSYHGTHCAGTAMGTGGPDRFFAGVAPGARLVDCKVLSDAGASVGGSNRGIEWVLANRNTLWAGLEPGSIWQGIDVVSMSLGDPTVCTGGSGTEDGASSTYINTAVDAGLVVVIATGNESATECIAPPAAADKSIAVGASAHYRTLERSDDKVTGFSNEGPRDDDGDADHFDEYKPNVVAPGAGIISAYGNVLGDGSEYQQLSGTSMATPHIAGCVALLLQANPALTPLQVRSILQNTADHDVPTEKATGDRGQDPYGIDPNYDPSCGWGLVDMYAACLEALNSTSGVQVIQVKATAVPDQGRIDFRWVTQREYPFQGFNVFRAPDVGNAPGTFTQLNGGLIAGTGDPDLEGDDNRQHYLWQDTDPTLTVGQQYWYKVEWVDQASVAHAEPPVPVAYGTLARVATAFYSIAHNAVDNDLLIRVGASLDYDAGNLGDAELEVLGPGESQQDSVLVVLPPTIPANTGTSTLGTLDHFWSVGFKQGDDVEWWLPPRPGNAWFLKVVDGGFVNRTGRVTSFSLFVNDSPGSASGTTYATNHSPMPAPLVEGGVVATTLWIPEQDVLSASVARFHAEIAGARPRLVLELTQAAAGATAQVFRNTSEDFATRELITPEVLPIDGARFEYVDATAQAGRTYSYWVALREASGRTIMNGPVTITALPREAVAFTRAPYPNPVLRGATFEYAIGADVAEGDAVSIAIHDVQGRVVKTLATNLRREPGVYTATWDATNDRGMQVANGRYYLRLSAGKVTKTSALTVVR
jgi:subtilisin family serine protease